MAAVTCPACGATSATTDYCDSCGAALAAPPSAAAPAPVEAPPPPAPVMAGACPNCGAVRSADDAFCEVCGLDFASGQLPAAPAPKPAATDAATAAEPSGWVAVIDADRAFYDSTDAGGLPFPDGVTAREVALTGDEVEIGRRSEGKGYFPAIDLSAPVADPAVSHHHAVLRRQGDGSWALVDEGSTNGTFLNGELTPLAHGAVTALHDGDRINLGSFTRITFKQAGS